MFRRFLVVEVVEALEHIMNPPNSSLQGGKSGNLNNSQTFNFSQGSTSQILLHQDTHTAPDNKHHLKIEDLDRILLDKSTKRLDT